MRSLKNIFLPLLFASSTLCAATSEEYVLGQNQFAFRMLQQFDNPKTNLCFSPYSIGNALSLAYVGADGQTKSEIAILLSYPRLDDETLCKDIHSLETFLAPVVQSAEAVAVDATFTLNDTYLKTVKDKLGAEIFEIHPSKNIEESVATVNRWVKDKTKGFIPKLLMPGDINSGTKMVLLNAVYCKTAWRSPFSENETKEEPFFTRSGEKIPIAMMHKKENVELYQDQDVSIVWKPMRLEKEGGPELETVIILPNSEEALNTLQRTLSFQKIDDCRNLATREHIELVLPKCSLRQRSELKDVLQTLGMKQAFTDAANFSRIHPANILKVQQVIHEAFMQMDEVGIEAASATAITMVKMSIIQPQKPAIVVRCDKPFFVLLQEKGTNLVLFVSLIQRPEKTVKM